MPEEKLNYSKLLAQKLAPVIHSRAASISYVARRWLPGVKWSGDICTKVDSHCEKGICITTYRCKDLDTGEENALIIVKARSFHSGNQIGVVTLPWSDLERYLLGTTTRPAAATEKKIEVKV